MKNCWPVVSSFIFLVLSSTQSFALDDLKVIEGDYLADLSQVETLSVLEVEGVWAISATGRDRLEKLRDMGASCLHIQRGLYRCTQHLDKTSLPDSVFQNVNERFQDSRLIAGPSKGSELLYGGDLVKEYLVEQDFSIIGPGVDKSYSFTRYFYGQNIQKVQTGKESPSSFSFVCTADDSQLNLVLESSQTIDHMHFRRWVYTVRFQQ